MQGIHGTPVDISSMSQFDRAIISFRYDPDSMEGSSESDLAVFYLNPQTQALEPIESSVDVTSKTVSATVTHFSTYVLADMRLWANTWRDNLLAGQVSRGNGGGESVAYEIVFAIDSSGSMAWNDPERVRVEGTKSLIDAMEGGDRAAIVDFDSSAKLLHPLSADRAALKQAADRIDDWGGTNIGAGLRLALDELERNGRQDSEKTVILLTDGVGAFDRRLTGRARALGIVVYTIGLGEDIDQDLLEAIAEETGGDFYFASDADALRGIFTEVGRDITSDDSDGDGLPDWVERQGMRRLGDLSPLIFTDPQKADTDGDGLLDGAEVGDWCYAPGDNEVFVSASVLGDGSSSGGEGPCFIARPFRSYPILFDSDGDGDSDLVDDKPLLAFSPLVMLIHGTMSNGATAWGADAWADNNTPLRFAGEKDRITLTRNVPNYLTFTGRSYRKGDELDYWNIDAHFIRELPQSSGGQLNFAPHLVLGNAQYQPNKNLFVFNWEANDTIGSAVDSFERYLQALSSWLTDNVQDVDFTLRNRRPQFLLIGHSAGGLVSRLFIENRMGTGAFDPHVLRLISVDTPHWGSNALHNPGWTVFGCNSIFSDLDREQSPLFRSDTWYHRDCGRQADLLSLEHGTTEYVAMQGLIMRDSYAWPASEDIAIRSIPLGLVGDKALFDHVQDLALTEFGVTIPSSLSSKVTSERVFGDTWVTVDSGFGIPSDEQQKHDASHARALALEGRHLFFGAEAQVTHTAIEHQIETFWFLSQMIVRPANLQGW